MSDSESAFGRVLRRARALERLNAKVAGLIGPDLARACQVANLRDGKLVFTCNSPGCATRLRMQAPLLLEKLHAAGLDDIESIEVKLLPQG